MAFYTGANIFASKDVRPANENRVMSTMSRVGQDDFIGTKEFVQLGPACLPDMTLGRKN